MTSLRAIIPHAAPLAVGLLSVICYLLLPAHWMALLPVLAAFIVVLVLHERDDYRRARYLIDSGALRGEMESGRSLEEVALELLAKLRRTRRRDWWVHGPLLASSSHSLCLYGVWLVGSGRCGDFARGALDGTREDVGAGRAASDARC